MPDYRAVSLAPVRLDHPGDRTVDLRGARGAPCAPSLRCEADSPRAARAASSILVSSTTRPISSFLNTRASSRSSWIELATSGGLGGAASRPPRSWSATGPARGRAGRFDPVQLHHAAHRRQTPGSRLRRLRRRSLECHSKQGDRTVDLRGARGHQPPAHGARRVPLAGERAGSILVSSTRFDHPNLSPSTSAARTPIPFSSTMPDHLTRFLEPPFLDHPEASTRPAG